ncbi:MAG: trypsin-like peptidase domain-containing protein, partial [Spirochaetales bacterium]
SAVARRRQDALFAKMPATRVRLASPSTSPTPGLPTPQPTPRSSPSPSNPAPQGSSTPQAPSPLALGTGFVVDEMGTILTCFHVIAPEGKIVVTFSDGLETEATVLYAMPENDLAILKPAIIPDDVVPAVLAGSGHLQIGDSVVAIGNPFGVTGSVTQGVISGLGRSFISPRTGQRMINLIQFDAAVNPGNSGGPLVDQKGEVVGVVSALLNPTEQEVFIGIGFAVPLESAASAIGIPPW